MIKQYVDNLYDRFQDGKELTQTECGLMNAYRNMQECGHDWIGIDKASSVDAVELVKIMKSEGINGVYITEEWSNQFSHWYDWQEAGLKMCGVVKFDNPRYLYHLKRWGCSDDNPHKLVLKFSL